MDATAHSVCACLPGETPGTLMEGRPEGNGKEENSIRAPFPRQIPLNGGESFFSGWICFSGMSVIQIWKTAAREGSPFFQPGLRIFSHSAFLRREHYLAESGLFWFPLTRVCSYQPLPSAAWKGCESADMAGGRVGIRVEP